MNPIDERKQLDKLRILLNAVRQTEEAPDFRRELEAVARDVLRENPGADFGQWRRLLMEQYPTEIVDALGTNRREVDAALVELYYTLIGYGAK